MGSHLKFFADILSGGSSHDEVKDIFCINCQSTDFRRRIFHGPGNVAGFAAIPVETERAEICRRELDGIPF